MGIKSIKNVKDIQNKTVLVRCDFDVPLNSNSNIVDDTRLQAAIPTIKYLLRKKAKLVLIGSLGRPSGQVVPALSLIPVKKYLENELGQQIDFQSQIPSIAPKADIVMIENLRFFIGEKKNDKNFARQLANLGDIYVNESFAMSHREVASMDAIQEIMPSYAGFHLEKEVESLSRATGKTSRPLVAIIGGAKIETKLPVIERFLKKADYLLIGGAVANNFFDVLGFEVGRSKMDKEYLKEALKLLVKSESGLLGGTIITKNKLQEIFRQQITNSTLDLKWLKDHKHSILLPVDVIVKDRNGQDKTKLPVGVEKTDSILDIGPKTIDIYSRIIKGSRTVVWNGPMGLFEEKEYSKGTMKVASAIIDSRSKAVVGGGETAEAFSKINKKTRPGIFISTGGGAMLEFLGGKKLPGLKRIVK